MTVTIQGHTYEMSRTKFNEYIKQIKKMIPKKQLTIIAIEKDGHVEMRNDVYKTQKELTEAICSWNKQGYAVKYSRGL